MEGSMASPSTTDERLAGNGGSPGSPPRKGLKPSTRIGLRVIGALALLATMAFVGTYFLYSRNYVITDNAQVDGDKISINAPATGFLTIGPAARARRCIGLKS